MDQQLTRQIPWWTWVAAIIIQIMARFTGPFIFVKPALSGTHLSLLGVVLFAASEGLKVYLGWLFWNFLKIYFLQSLDDSKGLDDVEKISLRMTYDISLYWKFCRKDSNKIWRTIRFS